MLGLVGMLGLRRCLMMYKIYELMISDDSPQCTNIKIAGTITFDHTSERVS